MKQLKRSLSVMLVLVVTLAVMGQPVVLAVPAAATATFTGSPFDVNVGQEFDVTLNVNVDETTNAVTMSFAYDTTCLDVTALTQPTPDQLDLTTGTSFDDTAGTVTVNEGKLIGSATGSIDVLIVTFQATCEATGVVLDWDEIGNLVVDAVTYQPIATTWTNGEVNISTVPPTSIALAPATQTIEAGGTADLTATVDPTTWPGQVAFTTSAGVVSPTMASLDGSGQAATQLSGVTLAQTVVVTASASGMVDTAEVVVTADMTDPPASVDLTPKDATVTAGATQAYTLMATDGYGNDWDASASATFAIDAAAGGSWTVNSYTAALASTWNVTGTLSGVSDSTTLTVNMGTATSTNVTLSSGTVTAGETLTYTVEACDDYGNCEDVTGDAAFDIPGAGGAGGNGVYTPTVSGTYTATATYGGNTGEATVTVEPDDENPVSVEVTPEDATMVTGDSLDYTLMAYDTYDNGWDVTISGTFGIDAGAGGSWTDNTYTAENTGVWTVTGSWDVFSDTTGLTVLGLPHLVATISGADVITVTEGMTFTVAATISNTGASDAVATADLAVTAGATVVTTPTMQSLGTLASGAAASASWVVECTAEGAVTVTVTPAGTYGTGPTAIPGANLDDDSIMVMQEPGGFFLYLPLVMRNH